MNFSVNILAQSIIDLCFKKNIKNIVISPGSRNAPLVLVFNNNPFFKTYIFFVERFAAFFSLVLSQHINEPVVLVCTSGSALLNYYPAISEAYFSNIPLVVLSADRPKEFLNIGDGQTINQKNVFEKNIEFSFENNLILFLWSNWKQYKKILKKNIHHALLTADFVFLDEAGKVLSELLAILDIILCRLQKSNMPFGGVLIIGTLDHTQIQPVNAYHH